jgi:hypothetical protein
LKRIWIVVSVPWGIGWLYGSIFPYDYGFRSPDEWWMPIGIGMGGLLGWWVLLYSGIWIVSGFGGDDKKEETDE